RAREIDAYLTVDTSPIKLRALVDPIPPRLSARLGREGIEVTVRDEESSGLPGLRLEMKASNADDWVPVDLAVERGQGEARIGYPSIGDAREVRFRAQDGSGNPTQVITLSLRASGGSVPSAATSGEEASSSCNGVGAGSTGALWMAIGLVFGMLRWRHRT
ncbi:MAG: hypothetical protein AAF449_20440, partial [Myxococcota bacterium]